MSLIRLTDSKGNVVFVNPDLILFIAGGSSNGSPVIGESAVVLNNGMTLSVPGTPADVANEIAGLTASKNSSFLTLN